MSVPAQHIADIQSFLEQHERKELLRFVTVGSVDDGKSTLIGRLLHDTRGVYEDQLSAVVRATKKRGGDAAIDFSLLTDGLKAEREQGITIDVAYRYFSTDKRKFIIADTPGHVQYTRNMATGASTADVALILIDARHGVLQQSRRHAYIASLLGIPHLAVCVNKMDLLDYAEQTFTEIVREFRAYARPLRFREVSFFPISAVEGDNVVHASDKTAWYEGGTLLEYLETVPIAADRNLDDLRLPVQIVLRPDLDYRGFSGQLASGIVRRGDEVQVLPSRKRSKVRAIDVYEGEIDEAFAPMSVTLRLEDEIDVSRGDMIVHPGSAPNSARRFEADVVWMSEQPLDPERGYLLKHTARVVRASIDQVLGRLDLETLEEVPADELALNDIGKLRIVCNQPLHMDPYVQNRATGAFVLIDALTNNTVAAGMVVRALADRDSQGPRRQRSEVSADERRQRLGHAPAAVWFAGPPRAAHESIAFALERLLFDRGCVATVIDVIGLSDGTRSPLLLADLVEQSMLVGAVAILGSGVPRAADRGELVARIGSGGVLVALEGDEAAEGALLVDGSDPQAAAALIVTRLSREGVFEGSDR
jgi:sulfate adenylyltransferase large subunit